MVSRTCMGLAYACSPMQIQCKYRIFMYLHHANTMQESHAATSEICKYICKPQFLHVFAYASPCKPMQARCKSRASSCRRMRPEPNHSQCCQMLKKDESRLLEVVGSIPSMCLHVSVLCLDAWHSEILVSASCCIYASTMHLHMQARCKKLMQRLQGYASTYALYLHCICMMQVQYLHCICMGAACICKSHTMQVR